MLVGVTVNAAAHVVCVCERLDSGHLLSSEHERRRCRCVCACLGCVSRLLLALHFVSFLLKWSCFTLI